MYMYISIYLFHVCMPVDIYNYKSLCMYVCMYVCACMYICDMYVVLLNVYISLAAFYLFE